MNFRLMISKHQVESSDAIFRPTNQMVRIGLTTFLIFMLFGITPQLLAQGKSKSKKGKIGRVKVVGNEFVDQNNEVIVFRGVSSSDPDKLETDGYWSKGYFQEMSDWGVTIVRFPIHPPAWERRGKKNYLKLLDKGIKWAGSLGMHVVIDWHSIGNLLTTTFQDEIYITSQQQTEDFWKTISQRYGDNPTVAFYELFNEPTTFNGTYGELSWEDWKKWNEDMITLVRANGGEGIPLVAGFNWAYDLTPVRDNPIDAEGIGYVSHPYPQKREKPWLESWVKDWGFVKDNYPLILTEIGFCGPEDPGAHIPVISDESYGEAITQYCDENNVSYVAWVFDLKWAPRLYVDEAYTPSRHGRFFKAKMQGYQR